MIVQELEKRKIAPIILSLENKKEILNEVIEYKNEKLEKFGINNKTYKFILEKDKEIKDHNFKNKNKVANNELLKAISSIFGIYSVIEYKVLHQIAKDYNLFITSLSKYNEVIPDENLEELEEFTNFLKNNKDNFNKFSFGENSNFIFTILFGNKSISSMSFDKLFYIMCPKSHININKNDTIIGREINEFEYPPKFNLNIKFNKPEPKDPIIIMPFKVSDKIFNVVITSWDKVGNDERIRKMI